MDTDKWPQFYREVYRCLKPGGWIEHIEAPPVVAPAHGGIITQNSPCHVWNNFFFAAASKTGRGFEAPDLESMSSAGFTDMKTRVQTLPIGVWPKDESFKRIGAVMQKLLCNNLDGLALRLAWDLGFGTQEMQMVFMQVRRDLQRPDNLFCIECSMAWARKPGAT
ncbi:hypothetical protein B0T14DRAFT_5681 [Immersiella caudata]|uniref:Methyltransferase n=1 Tax=Immersiella caudata TaxID=314043 RepID=A0AA40CAX1_9PEZI|nr:hypothetical protein B0T14DRAFT_5681 [Immersiella caudata]